MIFRRSAASKAGGEFMLVFGDTIAAATLGGRRKYRASALDR